MINYTLTIVLDKTAERVLMCFHHKQNLYNFIGGHIEANEDEMEASYRELYEETGISGEDIELLFVRDETVLGNKALYSSNWHMFVTCGILNKDVELIEEKNQLYWIPINDSLISNQSMGFGNCRVFLNEALTMLSKQ